MTRDLSAEPTLATDEIQGDVLVGLAKLVERFVFFTIGDGDDDRAAFRAFLRTLPVTTMRDALDQRAAVTGHRALGGTGLVPTPGLNLAFTAAGLAALGQGVDVPQFTGGMASSQVRLQDPADTDWAVLGPAQRVHGVFLLTGSTPAEVDGVAAERLGPPGAHGWTEVFRQDGAVRPAPVQGHEHFGFADGVSQPAVRGLVGPDRPLDPTTGPDDDQAQPGRDLLWPGEFVFGYPGQRFVPGGANDVAEPGDPPQPETDLTRNGSFLVFRRLTQRVPEFAASVRAAAEGLDPTGVEPSADLLGAQLVGRWKSGAPLVTAPHADDPSVGEGTPGALDFEFDGDRAGLLCPWAAHIRKAYPRDDVRGDVGPTRAAVEDAEAFTQTHRMIRRGITFGPEVSAEEEASGTTTQARGLLFACYVTDIGDQFEFVQESWVDADEFVQPGAGIDALIGQRLDVAGKPVDQLPFVGGMPFDPATQAKPRLDLGRFVHMEGGGYFFAPSVTAIHGLLAEPTA